MNPIIDKIAKVLYLHDVGMDHEELYPWDLLDEDSTQEHYRRLARGAVAALGLTQQVAIVEQHRQ